MTLAGSLATTAQAQSYGEIGTPFGSKGKKNGEFTVSTTVHAFGVDPTDNSIYAGDEPLAGEESSAEYRIQKFTSAGKFLASASFKVKPEGPEGGFPVGLQGIAVDPNAPGGGRVYALVVYEREEEEGEKLRKTIEKEEKELKEGKIAKVESKPRPDGEDVAAGILYAFSTTPSGETLVPAKNEKGEPFPEGVFASKVALNAQSEVTDSPTQSALLEPAGIAVDPTTHDVIILGQEDQSTAGSEELLTAAQRVNPDGTLGARWVDTGECFETGRAKSSISPSCFSEDEEALQPGYPTSPVVTSTGHVLADVPGNEIWELPQNFATGEPKPVVRFAGGGLQNLLSFPGGVAPTSGAALAYIHEASEPAGGSGRLYVTSELAQEGLLSKARYPAVTSFQLFENGSWEELGWTAGANKAQHPNWRESTCSISAFSQAAVAGATGGKLIVFDPGVTPGNSNEPIEPHVLTFGPGGGNCLTPSATKPVATIGTTEVGTSSNPAQVAQKVEITSNVSLGNVLSVEWSFGDGSPNQTVTKEQFQTARIEHAFTGSPGEDTVTATIKTDNLAEPTVKVSSKVIVAPSSPTAQFTQSTPLTVGVPVKFTSTSNDPNKSALVKYVWNFGDGSEATSTSPTIEHTYSSAASFNVTLTVTDALGLSGSTNHSIAIASGGTTTTPPPPPPPPPPPSTTNTTTTPPPSGVLGTTTAKGNPAATLASTSLTVTSSGGFPVKVTCPAGEASCSGTVTLKTLSAVSAGAGKKKAILTLASGSFTLAGGSSKTVTLHLSSQARTLLAHSHVLKARATILAHDPTGASHTTVLTVTLKPAKKH